MNDRANFEASMLKAVELFPDYTDALINLGNLYMGDGELSKAKTYLERAKNIEPDNKKVIDLYNMLPDSLKTGN